MKTLIAFLVLAAQCCGVRPAFAAVTAEVALAEDGDRLYSKVRVRGVEAGQVIYVNLVWKAPDVFHVSKNGDNTRLFAEGGKLPTKGDGRWAVGDADPKARCFCQDTGEKGCWRTRANFLIEYLLPSGAKARAVGVWTVSLVDSAGLVLGSGSYTVK
jgi:hypothetical protein